VWRQPPTVRWPSRRPREVGRGGFRGWLTSVHVFEVTPKAVPNRPVWPEGSRRFRLPDFPDIRHVCIAELTLGAALLARSQYPEGPATGHLDTGFILGFPVSLKQMLRWFPSFQVATTCLSCSPPDLNSLATFLFPYLCTCKVTTTTG
jgi:hypothetical protein